MISLLEAETSLSKCVWNLKGVSTRILLALLIQDCQKSKGMGSELLKLLGHVHKQASREKYHKNNI